MTSVVTPEETQALDQTMLDLEISSWECLEEQANEPAMGRLVDEASRAVNSDA